MIWMKLESQLAKSLLDLILSSRAGQAKYFVVIAVRGHELLGHFYKSRAQNALTMQVTLLEHG